MSQQLDLIRFPLKGSQLIEASAGTGKTFTLAHLYTRLVLGHGGENGYQRPLMPPEILVVTFTDAATQELRDRIRAKLVEAADIFALNESEFDDLKDHDSGNPLVHLRQDIEPEQYSQCTRQLIQAAEWMDESSISTIHGWCHRMLHEHAFHSGSLFDQELVTDQSELLEQVVQDYWRSHFYSLRPEAALLVLQNFPSPDALKHALLPLLKISSGRIYYQGHELNGEFNVTDRLLQELTHQNQLIELENNARNLWLKDKAGIEQALTELQPSLNGTKHNSSKPDKFNAFLAEIADWSQGQKAPSKLGNFASGRFAYKKGKDQPEPDFPVFAALKQWQDALSEEADGSSLKQELLVHAALWCQSTFNQRQQAKAQMGFDDLLSQLDQALQGDQGEALAASIRQQFPVALIDEFQDTDPIQYRIFNTVYKLEENNPDNGLILIGDPKQAIYAFRGADIYTYLQAKSATKGRHHTLKKNYRSTRGVVEATNTLFEQASHYAYGPFRFQGDDLPFEAVDAQGKVDSFIIQGQTAPAMQLWHLPPEEGLEKVNSTSYRVAMAESSASEIVRLLNLGQQNQAGFGSASSRQSSGSHENPIQGVKPSNIAILVRNKTEADAIQTALANRNVNSVYLSDRDSVFATQEAEDLLIWLKACAEPNRDTLLRNALATSTLDLPIGALDELNHDELAWESKVEQFSLYRRLWWQQGVLAMCHRLLHDFELPARLLTQSGGERRLTNVLHLAEWLQECASTIEGDFALIRFLAEHIGESADEFILRLESDDDLVKVVTIHKSKGLEYPLVFLPFIASWKEASSDLFSYQPNNGERIMELAGKKGAPESWLIADAERLSEDLRLLYVALTRAKYATWLGVAPLAVGNSKKPQLEKGALGYLLNGGAEFTAEGLQLNLTELTEKSSYIQLDTLPEANDFCFAESNQQTLGHAQISQVQPRDPWWIASYSSLQTGAVTGSNGTDPSITLNTLNEFEPSETEAPTLPDAPDTALQATAEEESDQMGDIQLSAAVLDAESKQLLRELHLFPRGANAGTFLHGLLEWAAEEGFDLAISNEADRLDMLSRRCQLRGWQQWINPLNLWLEDFLSTPWDLEQAFASARTETSQQTTQTEMSHAPLQLSALEIYQAEMEFWFEAHHVKTQAMDQLVRQYSLNSQPRPEILANELNGMLKGFIDLVVQHDGRYYVIDWKSNYIGPENSDYHYSSMLEAILKKRYDMQYLLYILALHRHLKSRLPNYDYDQHVGGALYLFLRGSHSDSQGVFADRPEKILIEQLDQLFAGISQEAC